MCMWELNACCKAVPAYESTEGLVLFISGSKASSPQPHNISPVQAHEAVVCTVAGHRVL